MKIVVNCVSDLSNVCKDIIGYFDNNSIVCVEAEMGVGKTTLIKYICKELGVQDLVNSPTFSIVNEYLSAQNKIYHFDWYRINNIDELIQIGIMDYFEQNNLCFIEWSSKFPSIIPESAICIHIALDKYDKRIIEIIKK